MSRGLHKLMGGTFTRIRPGLCPTCVHLDRQSVEEWEYCTALNKLLSNPHTTPGKCDRYEPGEQKMTDEEIERYHQSAREHQAYLRQRRTGRSSIDHDKEI